MIDLALRQHQRPRSMRLINCWLLIGGISSASWLAMYFALEQIIGN